MLDEEHEQHAALVFGFGKLALLVGRRSRLRPETRRVVPTLSSGRSTVRAVMHRGLAAGAAEAFEELAGTPTSRPMQPGRRRQAGGSWSMSRSLRYSERSLMPSFRASSARLPR